MELLILSSAALILFFVAFCLTCVGGGEIDWDDYGADDDADTNAEDADDDDDNSCWQVGG